MEFVEKLKALTSGENKSLIARRAGLSPTAISDYLQKGYIPRADKALMLARGLGVPLEWLLDSTKGMPPPKAQKFSAGDLSDEELMDEAARRYRRQVLRALASVRLLEGIKDWPTVARQIVETPPGNPLPAQLAKLVEVLRFVQSDLFQAANRFNVRTHADMNTERMPGGLDVDLDEIEPRALEARFRQFVRDNPFASLLLEYAHFPDVIPEFNVVEWRLFALKRLENLKASPAAKIDSGARRALESRRSTSGRKRKA
jgi:transcriptional regulator with XRE-family HTH domain